MFLRKMAAAFLAAVSVVSIIPFSALAAPKTMSDGTVFDAEYYAANNPDVVAELGTGEDVMYTHYKMFGQAEGRLPYAVSLDGGTPFAVYNGIEFYKDGDGQAVMKDPYGRFAGDSENKVRAAAITVFDAGSYALYYRIESDCLRDSLGILGSRYICGSTGSPCYLVNYTGTTFFYISADSLLKLYQSESSFELTYAPELQARIKDGSSQKDAVTTVAKYVADSITYDFSIKGVREKNKIHCGTALEEGLGICHDYAEAFAALVALIPINEQGVVDWTCGTRNVIKANIVGSNTHAWNTVTYDGVTHQLDACWYDFLRSPNWLDMGAAEQADSSHRIGNPATGIAYLR